MMVIPSINSLLVGVSLLAAGFYVGIGFCPASKQDSSAFGVRTIAWKDGEQPTNRPWSTAVDKRITRVFTAQESSRTSVPLPETTTTAATHAHAFTSSLGRNAHTTTLANLASRKTARQGPVVFAAMDARKKWVSSLPLIASVGCAIKEKFEVNVVAVFQVPQDDDILKELREWTASQPFCNDSQLHGLNHIELIRDRKDMSSQRHDENNARIGKAKRIGELRDQMRSKLRGIRIPGSASTLKTAASAIVLFDADLRELPSVPSLVASIQRIRNGDWDVLCAAGMMGHHRTTKYYDTFATILANGDYPYRDIWVEQQEHGRDGTRETEHNREIFKEVIEDVENQWQTAARDGYTIWPVQSCFGGLAIYSPLVYFHDKCSYSQPPVSGSVLPKIYDPKSMKSTIQNAPCEHVLFHWCLRGQFRSKFQIGIVRGMLTLWDGS